MNSWETMENNCISGHSCKRKCMDCLEGFALMAYCDFCCKINYRSGIGKEKWVENPKCQSEGLGAA